MLTKEEREYVELVRPPVSFDRAPAIDKLIKIIDRLTAQPAAPEPDEVAEIEKRHSIVQTAIDDTSAMEWTSTQKGQLLVQAHQNIAILLRLLRTRPAERGLVGSPDAITDFILKATNHAYGKEITDALLTSGAVVQVPTREQIMVALRDKIGVDERADAIIKLLSRKG